LTSPLADPLLTVPFVGVAEFRQAPTWLDTSDLVENGSQSIQDAELYNTILRASRWAENFCDQPLRAHTTIENLRCRVNRYGQAFIHPTHNPVRLVTGLAYGSDPTLLTALTASQLSSAVWIEDARGLVISLLPIGATFLGSLQFGTVPTPGGEIFVTLQYIAGYANTYLTAMPGNAGANSLTVADPTGFMPPATSIFGTPVGASIARIWDPGFEEAVTVSSNYVAGSNPVSLASATVNPQNLVGAQVSELPAEIRQAVIAYTVALLLREDASDEGPFPGSPGPTARRSESGGAGGGLIEEAERLLMPYRRVR
jgi:hypothetical protein